MLRLGRVAFINTFPVEWALSRHLDPGEIREAGRVPVQRDSFYNVVRRFD